ncbi:hypothetical protein [Mycobacterium sp. C31M]
MTDVEPTLDAFVAPGAVEITERIWVAADAHTTYLAVANLDLLTVRTPVLVAAMWLRGVPARVTGRPVAVPPALVIGAGVGLPGWTILRHAPQREIVIGAVGKFWKPVIEWNPVPASGFREFDEPGWAKLAISFTIAPTESGTMVGYRCRTVGTDPSAERRFRRYWWLIKPFVGHIMRATLRTVKHHAEGSLRG